MKKSLAFCLMLAAFVSCKDDTKQLLKTVDGNWKVNTITYARVSGPDSIVTPTALTLRFDNCSKSTNNSGPSNCAVSYVDGAKAYPFVYQAQASPNSVYINRKAVKIDSGYDALSMTFTGAYNLTIMTGNTMVMVRENPASLPGIKFVQYSATK